MNDVATLSAKLELLISQFERAINQAESKTRKAGKSIEQNLGTNIGKTVKRGTTEAEKSFSRLVWTAESGTKAISRVVTGILISQTFYRLVRIINQATREMYNFMVSMEQAYLALEIMLGSVKGAESMLARLETFAAVTPFQMEDVVQSTRKLLGFQYAAEEIMPIMEALADITAIIGVDPVALNSLTEAMGKIKALGRMEFRDLKLFASAGFPIIQALQEELGLTRDQIRNIAREAKGSSEYVIPAILNFVERKFGGAAERLSHTVRGLTSTIQDNLLLITKDVFSGLYETYRRFLQKIVDKLDELREVLVEKGIGGLFEAIIPEKYQEPIRQMIAHLMAFGRALKEIWRAIAPLREALLEVFVRILQIAIPVLTIVANLIAGLTRWIFQSTGVMRNWAIAILTAFTVLNTLRIIVTITNAMKKLMVVMGLTTAATTKWMIALTLLVAVLTFILLQIPKVKEWFDNMFKSIAKWLGLDTSSILQPLKEIADTELPEDAFDQMADASDLAADSLEETEEEMEDVGKAVKDTKKEIDKFLMSFDEVYAIPEKAEDIDIPEVKMPEIKIPEILEDLEYEAPWGDLPEEIEELTEELDEIPKSIGNILPWLKNLGLWLAQPYIFAWKWIKAGYTLIGENAKAYWNLIKDVGSALIVFETEVAHATGTLIKDSWEATKTLGKDVGEAFKQLISEITAPIKEFLSGLWGAVKEFAKELWETIKTLAKDLWDALKELVKGIWEELKVLWRNLISVETLDEALQAFRNFFDNVMDLFGGFGQQVKDAFAKAGIAIQESWAKLVDNIKNLWGNLVKSLQDAWSNFIQNITSAFSKFGETIKTAWNSFVNSLKDAWNNFINSIKEALTNFANSLIASARKWVETIVAAFLDGFTYLIEMLAPIFGNWTEEIRQDFYEATQQIPAMVGAIFEKAIREMGQKVTEGLTNSIAKVREWLQSTLDSVLNWFKDIGDKIHSWFTDIGSRISSYVKNIISPVTNLINNFKQKLLSWIDNIRNFIDNIIKSVQRGINSLIRMINRIPGIRIPTIGNIEAVGSTVGAKLGGMQHGGILNKEQIVRAAEGGVPEAYTPLTASALRPWAEAIANALQSTGTQSGGIQESSWVAVPIDARGEIDLDRKLFVMRRNRENKRIVGVS